PLRGGAQSPGRAGRALPLPVRSWLGSVLGRSLDELVELPAIEPDAPALGAVVDLDAAALAHHQRGRVVRTLHVSPLVRPRHSPGRGCAPAMTDDSDRLPRAGARA